MAASISVTRKNGFTVLDADGKQCFITRDFKNPLWQDLFSYQTKNIDVNNPTKYIAFPQAELVGGAVIVTYQEGDSHGNSDRTKMRKGTISGGVVTYGAAVTLYENGTGVYDYSLLSGLMTNGQHVTFGPLTIKYTSAGSVYTPYSVPTVANGGLTYALWSPPVAGPGGVLWRTGYAVNGSDQQSALFSSANSGETWAFVKVLFSGVGKKYNETAICNTSGTNWIAFCRVDGETGQPLAFLSSTDDFTTLSAISQYSVAEINGRQPHLIKTTDNAVVLATSDRYGTSGVDSSGKPMSVYDTTGVALWRSTDGFATYSPRQPAAGFYSTDGGQPKPLEISANVLHVPYYGRASVSDEPGILSFTMNAAPLAVATELTLPTFPTMPTPVAWQETAISVVDGTPNTAGYDVSSGAFKHLTVTKALTFSISNWAPSGDQGEIWLELIDGGAFAVTWPAALFWVYDGGAVSATAPRTFKTSGSDFIRMWTRNGSATIYAEIVGGGTTPATAGGTGQTSFAVGDLLYASSTTALSKLAAGPVGNVLCAAGSGAAPLWGQVVSGPLVNYGGMNFNGTTTYLGTDALTGAVDGKTGTYFWYGRFANAASATEFIRNSTNTRFQVLRTSAGKIQISHEDSAGTLILSMITPATPCAAAGTYYIMASWDLTTPGTGRLYVGELQQNNETTYTNSTADWTVADNSIGASVGGTSFFAGDMYLEWLDTLAWMELNTSSNRRKFVDINGVPVFLGNRGELPAGYIPLVFHGYGGSDNWHINKGTATTSPTRNGAIADATTALYGQYGAFRDKTITPAGTTGNQTINKPMGSVNFAAASGSLTVTNNLVTVNSIITATVATADTTLKSVSAVPSNGSFLLTGNGNAAAETRVNFRVD